MTFQTGDRIMVLSLGPLHNKTARVVAVGGYGGVLTCELLEAAPPWRRGDVFHVPPYEAVHIPPTGGSHD